MPNFKIGRGTKVSLGTLTANVWTYTQLIGVDVISLPEPETEEVEVTHINSPGRNREYIAGRTDNGSVTLELFHESGSATDVALKAAYVSKETVALKYEIAGEDEPETWLGFCSGYTTQVSDGEAIKKTATFRISGPLEE